MKRAGGVLVVLGLVGCAGTGPGPEAGEGPRAVADEVLTALAESDLDRLADLAHPERGILFSPYAHVDPEEDVVLRPDEIRRLDQEDPVRTWGHVDGSGRPIEMTFALYREEFILDREFRDAPRVSVDERLGRSNTVDTIDEVFPEATTIEYHIPGSGPDAGGLDWASLRLVLVEDEGRWRVVAVVHDEWTI